MRTERHFLDLSRPLMTLTKKKCLILVLGIGDYNALRRDWGLKNGRDLMQTALSKSLTIFRKKKTYLKIEYYGWTSYFCYIVSSFYVAVNLFRCLSFKL